jgi:hypothetical protein
MPERIRSTARRVADSVPAITPVVRTPSRAIRYGEITL